MGKNSKTVHYLLLRWSIEGDSAVRSVAFSPDMLKLARGEGNDAIVCCVCAEIKNAVRVHQGSLIR